jgi:hypothetical protein
MMPMMPGVTPDQMAKFKEIGKYISISVIKHKRGFSVEFIPRVPEEQLTAAKVDVSQIVDNLVLSLGTQLNAYMGITGTLKTV